MKKHPARTRYHLVVRNAGSGRVIKEVVTDDKSELCYSFELFDRTKHLGFSKQAAALKNAPPDWSVTESYEVYNTFRKFDRTLDERYNFDVTISKVLAD